MKPENIIESSEVLNFAIAHFKEAGFEYEPIHGLRHLKNVIKEYETICEMCKDIDQQTIKLLKIAVQAHDLGRTMDGNHAENSARILERMPLYDLTTQEKSCIVFAVRNHSYGVKAVTGHEIASTPEELLLGLLCICDHADGASPEGYARGIIWAKQGGYETFSKKFSKDFLRKIIKTGYPRELAKELKSDSTISHLSFKASATAGIMKAVEHILSEEYIKHARMRQMMYEEILNLLLDLQPL